MYTKQGNCCRIYVSIVNYIFNKTGRSSCEKKKHLEKDVSRTRARSCSVIKPKKMRTLRVTQYYIYFTSTSQIYQISESISYTLNRRRNEVIKNVQTVPNDDHNYAFFGREYALFDHCIRWIARKNHSRWQDWHGESYVEPLTKSLNKPLCLG